MTINPEEIRALTQRLGMTPKPRDRAHSRAGFVPSGKNFDVSVGTTLRRLVEQGRVVPLDAGSKTLYKHRD